MTEVNGLRLAYRGFIGGLAGGYAWAAIAMTLAAIVHGDPLLPLAPFALALSPMAETRELAFVLGLGAVQVAGGFTGMCFAYFFGRFFTVRRTLALAAPAFAVLAWSLIGPALSAAAPAAVGHPIPVLATVGFGILLGAAVPVRAHVLRYSGSPVT